MAFVLDKGRVYSMDEIVYCDGVFRNGKAIKGNRPRHMKGIWGVVMVFNSK